MVKFESKAEGWDELERIKTCRSAITKLLIPEQDLHVANRDEMSVLLGYLDEQEEQVMEQLRPMLDLAV